MTYVFFTLLLTVSFSTFAMDRKRPLTIDPQTVMGDEKRRYDNHGNVIQVQKQKNSRKRKALGLETKSPVPAKRRKFTTRKERCTDKMAELERQLQNLALEPEKKRQIEARLKMGQTVLKLLALKAQSAQ